MIDAAEGGKVLTVYLLVKSFMNLISIIDYNLDLKRWSLAYVMDYALQAYANVGYHALGTTRKNAKSIKLRMKKLSLYSVFRSILE